jgi:hypothetical protein
MGYWGYGLMDGDTPLDIKDAFDDAMPVDGAGVLALFNRYESWGSDAIVVLAELTMTARLPLSGFCREKALAALEKEYAILGDWDSSSDRRRVLDAFKAELAAYPTS